MKYFFLVCKIESRFFNGNEMLKYLINDFQIFLNSDNFLDKLIQDI